jgi:NUMOD4 motif
VPERWLPVQGVEDYEVSSKGRVKIGPPRPDKERRNQLARKPTPNAEIRSRTGHLKVKLYPMAVGARSCESTALCSWPSSDPARRGRILGLLSPESLDVEADAYGDPVESFRPRSSSSTRTTSFDLRPSRLLPPKGISAPAHVFTVRSRDAGPGDQFGRRRIVSAGSDAPPLRARHHHVLLADEWPGWMRPTFRIHRRRTTLCPWSAHGRQSLTFIDCCHSVASCSTT